jgi:hypothetical protein
MQGIVFQALLASLEGGCNRLHHLFVRLSLRVEFFLAVLIGARFHASALVGLPAALPRPQKNFEEPIAL